MRISVDTNVLVSASFWYGDSFEILKKVENKEIELVISKEIIEELVKVLDSKEIQDKIKNKKLEMKRTIEKIVSISIIVEPVKNFDIVEEDFEDNKILDCAYEGNVDFIVSQDNHLLKLKEFQGIRIITPKDFLNLI